MPDEPWPGQDQPPTRPAFGPWTGSESAGSVESTLPPGRAADLPLSGSSTGPSPSPPTWPGPADIPPIQPSRGGPPTAPSAFHQLLRGPSRRWWRPLLCLLVLALSYGLVLLVLTIATFSLEMVRGVNETDVLVDLSSPGAFLYLNLTLAVLLPLAVLSIRLVHRVAAGFAISVLGRVRWSWLARCFAVVVPIWVGYLGISVAVGLLTGEELPPPPDQWVLLLIIVLVTTPLQAAAEEVVFRGWIPQNLSVWVSSEKVSLVVGTAVSAAAFAIAHGSLDPWILADLLVFAVVASLITWRTGGLEAAIAIHVTNNVLVSVLTLSLGGWEQAFVDENAQGDPLQLVFSVLSNGLALLLLWRLAGRRGIDRRSRPPAATPGALPLGVPR